MTSFERDSRCDQLREIESQKNMIGRGISRASNLSRSFRISALIYGFFFPLFLNLIKKLKYAPSIDVALKVI